eukprot:612773_1
MARNITMSKKTLCMRHVFCDISQVNKTFLNLSSNTATSYNDGGDSVFSFVKQAHVLISAGHLSVHEWHKAVKVMFTQMVGCLSFLHSKHVCHFDISLENWLLNDVQITCVEHTNSPKHSKMSFNLTDFEIRLIDFGLSNVFPVDNYETDAHVGKRAYKSPENLANQPFNAQKNDIWCLGVTLWMMLFGCAPWHVADESDVLFNVIMNGGMGNVFKSWDVQDLDEDLIDLLQSLYQYEDSRISLNAIKNHLWIQ